MFNNLHSLDLTAQDIELIEAALQTQKKILSVQSQAGGSGAEKKLSELQQLISRVDRCVHSPAPRAPDASVGWLQWIGTYFAPATRCHQTR